MAISLSLGCIEGVCFRGSDIYIYMDLGFRVWLVGFRVVRLPFHVIRV